MWGAGPIEYRVFVCSAKLRIIWCVFTVVCLLDVTNAARVSSVSVPSKVNVSSADPLKLDCTFEYDSGDSNLTDQELVIKWELNNILLYQWISNGPIFVNNTIHDRIDTNYKIANQTHPTNMPLIFATRSIYLSGNYRCSIFTFRKEHAQGGTLQAFVPITNMTIEGNMDESGGYATITCKAAGLYPRPSLELRLNSNLTYSPTEIKETENNFYDINATLIAPLEDLTAKTIFNCTISLPEANFSRSVFYKFAKTGFQKFVSYNAYELGSDLSLTSAEGSAAGISSRVQQQNVILLFAIASAISLCVQ